MQADPVRGKVWVGTVKPRICSREQAHIGWESVLEVIETLIESEHQVVRCVRGGNGSERVEDRGDPSSEVSVYEKCCTRRWADFSGMGR